MLLWGLVMPPLKEQRERQQPQRQRPHFISATPGAGNDNDKGIDGSRRNRLDSDENEACDNDEGDSAGDKNVDAGARF